MKETLLLCSQAGMKALPPFRTINYQKLPIHVACGYSYELWVAVDSFVSGQLVNKRECTVNTGCIEDEKSSDDQGHCYNGSARDA